MAVVNDSVQADHLRAVLVKVTVDGQEIVNEAVGESMTGVPATTDMHFRNGAVAISYMSTLLLILVDEGTVSLDDKLSTWLPDIPHSRRGHPRPARADDLRLRRLRADPGAERRATTPTRSSSGRRRSCWPSR